MSVKSFHTFSGRNDFMFILARFLQGDDNGDVTVSIPSEIIRILCYETLKRDRSLEFKLIMQQMCQRSK